MYVIKKIGGESSRSHPPEKKGAVRPHKNGYMIKFAAVILKEIFNQGKKYPWPRPTSCPRCNSSRVWSHGYTTACFEGFDNPLFIKRYRCPDCGCVITMRPSTHFSRFQSSKETIRSSLQHKITSGRWPPDAKSRARMRHWLRNLKRQIKAILEFSWDSGIMAGYDKLLEMGKNPVSSAI